MPHANLVHFDDVEAEVIDRGPLRGRRQRLGAAAGMHRAGVSRYVLGPGEQAMPPHVHADEEEHVYVLAGSGLSWQDGRTWEVRAGDAIVHPAQGAAHTYVAGADGLDVLIFGTGSDTGMTWLPRSRSWWMGPRWLPDDGPSPFTREADLGPLELPEPEAGQCPFVASRATTEEHGSDRPGYHERWWRLGDAAGSRDAGLGVGVLEPGALTCPPHWHGLEEECFVVLEGDGDALIDDEVHPVRPGSVLGCPPGGIAHALRGGPAGTTYLVWGTRIPGDYAYFPRSRKLSFANGLHVRVEPVDYFDGEDDQHGSM